jgi:hypothetical protein
MLLRLEGLSHIETSASRTFWVHPGTCWEGVANEMAPLGLIYSEGKKTQLRNMNLQEEDNRRSHGAPYTIYTSSMILRISHSLKLAIANLPAPPYHLNDEDFSAGRVSEGSLIER